MSQGAETDLPFTAYPEFDLLAPGNPGLAGRHGKLIVGSGCFRAGRLSASIHSDFGPADQDKPTNQDYTLAWRPWPAGTTGISASCWP